MKWTRVTPPLALAMPILGAILLGSSLSLRTPVPGRALVPQSPVSPASCAKDGTTPTNSQELAVARPASPAIRLAGTPAVGIRQVTKEDTACWEQRYRDLTLAQLSEEVIRAEQRLKIARKHASMECFRNPKHTLSLEEFWERDRSVEAIYLPRFDEATSQTRIARILESEYPRVFSCKRELQWLLEKRVARKEVEAAASPPRLHRKQSPNSIGGCATEEWIVCGPGNQGIRFQRLSSE